MNVICCHYLVAYTISKHRVTSPADERINECGHDLGASFVVVFYNQECATYERPVNHAVKLCGVNHVSSKRRDDHMTRKLGVMVMNIAYLTKRLLTPAMNSPNAAPNFSTLAIANDVSAGSQKLPGASFLEKPSIKMTITKSMVEMIPSMEVYDKRDNGRNTVGIKLSINIKNNRSISFQNETKKGILTRVNPRLCTCLRNIQV